MDTSTIKVFNSSTSLQEAEGIARTPSPPMAIIGDGPVQEHQTDALSQILVTSISCPSLRKSYGASVGVEGRLGGAMGCSLDHGMPTLDPAGSQISQQAGFSVSLSLSGQDEFHSLPAEGSVIGSMTLGQRLGERNEDLRVFMSEEITAKIPHRKLLRCCRRGHTWDRRILVDVDKRKGVKVHAFLAPKVRDSDILENTKLNITATVRHRLRLRLQGRSEKCWVIVNTDILDRSAGKSIHRTEGAPYAISIDDGQVNFSQVLVPYEQAKGCACEHVTLVIKVIFIIAPNVFHLKDEKEEDGFTIIEKEE